jgi:hypothetical protein
MEFTKGYFFDTLLKANNAIKKINEGEGIPNNNNSTLTYCRANKCVGGYFILVDEVTNKYLSGVIDVKLLTQNI